MEPDPRARRRSLRLSPVLSLLSWCVLAGLVGVVAGYATHRWVLAETGIPATPAALRPLSIPATVTLPRAVVAATPVPRTTREPVTVPTPTPGRPGVPIARIVVPAIGVNAPVVVKSLDPDGRMQAPDTPSEVAWYDFTALPGEGSNVVLAGHVDFAGTGPAVFWDLWRLQPGDTVQLVLVDGSIAVYEVVSSVLVEEATAPVAEIVGASSADVVTLITCAGTYDPSTGRYDQRLIVRAQRVDTVTSSSLSTGIRRFSQHAPLG